MEPAVPIPAAPSARLIAWFAIAVLAALNLFAFWPGIMVWDAIRQYGQALSGHYDDWHPPALAWLWRQLSAFGPGPAPILVVQALLYWGGLGLLIDAAVRRRQVRLAVAIGAIGALPIGLVLIGSVLKDSLMAGALLLASGLIAMRRPHDKALAILAALLLIAAATLRFNAIPACLPLALLLWPRDRLRTRRGFTLAAIASAVPLLLAMPVANRLLHAEKSGVELSLVIYDLGGITLHTGQSAFPPLPIANPVAVNARCYTTQSWDSYAWWTADPCPISFAMVRDALAKMHVSPTGFWLHALANHPTAYAEHRFAHFNQNSRLLTDDTKLHGLSLQTDPNPWGFAVPPSRLRDAIGKLADRSVDSPLGWPACWIALAFAAVLLMPRGAPLLAYALGWSSLLYGLSYLPLSVATEVRYHLWTSLAAAMAAGMAVASGGITWRSWRAVVGLAPLVIAVLAGISWRLF
jgi:hypothetical protein